MDIVTLLEKARAVDLTVETKDEKLVVSGPPDAEPIALQLLEVVGPATDPSNWAAWPISMIPVAAVGMLLALRVWHAKPGPSPKR